MTTPTENIARAAGAEIALIRGGSGKPLLILHDELGYPGWMTWNETPRAGTHAADSAAARLRQNAERIDWIRNYRDLAGFYSQVMREMKLEPIDVIGFSAGGFIAAEMVAADPRIFSTDGAGRADGNQARARRDHRHLRGDDAHSSAAPPSPIRPRRREFAKIYGGEMTPEQFEAFEDARAETARIGWEPYMHNPSLPHLLRGTKTPTLLVWGTHDGIVPRGCIDAYRAAIEARRWR